MFASNRKGVLAKLGIGKEEQQKFRGMGLHQWSVILYKEYY